MNRMSRWSAAAGVLGAAALAFGSAPAMAQMHGSFHGGGSRFHGNAGGFHGSMRNGGWHGTGGHFGGWHGGWRTGWNRGWGWRGRNWHGGWGWPGGVAVGFYGYPAYGYPYYGYPYSAYDYPDSYDSGYDNCYNPYTGESEDEYCGD